MSEEKTPVEELLWLYRLRQQALDGFKWPAYEFLSPETPCTMEDCLPWHHTLSQCPRGVEKLRDYYRSYRSTPAS